MRYMVRKSVVDVLGRLWMPMSVASLRIELSAYDVENARGEDGRITRESVADWLSKHSGDFSEVLDFRASIEDGDETIELDWARDESECAYCDTLDCEE